MKRKQSDIAVNEYTVTKEYTVVTVDFCGFGSWIQKFNSEIKLREYLINEISPEKDLPCINYSLKKLMIEAQKFTMAQSRSNGGVYNFVAAIFEGGNFFYMNMITPVGNQFHSNRII